MHTVASCWILLIYTYHEFCFKLDNPIRTVGQEQLFPGSKVKKRYKFLDTRRDEFLFTLELPSIFTLLLSLTNAALERMTVEYWRRIESVLSQRVRFNIAFYRFNSEVNLNNTSKFAIFEFLTPGTVYGFLAPISCISVGGYQVF